MPTPLQLLLDPISLTVFALFGTLILLEALFPARPLVAVPGWRVRGPRGVRGLFLPVVLPAAGVD